MLRSFIVYNLQKCSNKIIKNIVTTVYKVSISIVFRIFIGFIINNNSILYNFAL